MSNERTPQQLHPLHSVEFVAQYLTATATYPGSRRTGRSTASALALLSTCIRQPYKWFLISDHHGSVQADQHLKNLVCDLAGKMGLINFVYNGQYVSLGQPDSVAPPQLRN